MAPTIGPQRLFFVAVDAKSPGKNVEAQRSIRTHVMLDRQRKRRLADMEKHRIIASKSGAEDTRSGPDDAETAPSDLTDHNQSEGSGEVLSNNKTLGLGRLSVQGQELSQEDGDVLERPIPYDMDPRQFVYQYIWFWHGDHVQQLCGHKATVKDPKNPSQWLTIVEGEKALVYGQAYSADAHLQFTENQSAAPRENRFSFKGPAITGINRNIEVMKGGIDDGTIAAVLAVASAVFWEYRSRSEFMVHLNGLRKMVQLKGGLGSVESSILRDLLTLFELYPAILYRMKPQFPINRRKLPIRLPYLPSSPSATVMSNPLMSCGGFAHVFKQIAFKRPTLQLFTDMYDLTLILEAHHFHITPLQIREATIKRSQIRDKVLLLSKQQRLEQSEPDPVLEATLLASIIYLRALVYLIPFRDPVNHRIAHLLRLSLSRSMPQRSWHQLPGLLLWTLMVGGASVLDQPDFPFFSGHVMGEGIAISVMYFEEMHHILLKFLWIVNMLDRVPKFSYGSGVEESPGPAMFDFLVNQDLDAVAKRTTALRS